MRICSAYCRMYLLLTVFHCAVVGSSQAASSVPPRGGWQTTTTTGSRSSSSQHQQQSRSSSSLSPPPWGLTMPHPTASFLQDDTERSAVGEHPARSRRDEEEPTAIDNDDDSYNDLLQQLVTTIQPLLPHDKFIVVSVVHDDNHRDERSACLVIPGGSAAAALHYDTPHHVLPMAHTMALLSDIMVVILPGDDSRSTGTRKNSVGWTAGWTQRKNVLGHGAMLIVQGIKDPEQFVLQHADWSPCILDRFDVLKGTTCNGDQWRHVVADCANVLARQQTGTTQSILDDAELFPAVLEQTYHSMGGRMGMDVNHPRSIHGITTIGSDKETRRPTVVSSVLPDVINEDVLKNWSKDMSPVATDEATDASPTGVGAILAPSTDSLDDSNGDITSDCITADQVDNEAEPEIAITNQLLSNEDIVWQMIQDIQKKQEDNILDAGSMPMDFGLHAGAVLERLVPVSDLSTREAIMNCLKERYAEHLEQLRDYFGKMYETVLERGSGTNNAGLQERIVRSFRSAAQEAIPVAARAGGKFCGQIDLDYIAALAGLSSDLQTLSENHQDIDTVLLEAPDEDAPSARRRRIPPWCRKLASKAIMLGVNYIQGRLALHSIRQAALERERDMPKIPLF